MPSTQSIIPLIIQACAALYACYGLYNAYYSDQEEFYQAVLHPIGWALGGLILHYAGLLKRIWPYYVLTVTTLFIALSAENELFWEETIGRFLDLFWEPWLEEYPGSGFLRWYKIWGEDLVEEIQQSIQMLLLYLTIGAFFVIRYIDWIAVHFLGEAPNEKKDPICGIDYSSKKFLTPPPPEEKQLVHVPNAYDRYNNALYWARITGRECPDRSHFFDARRMHDGYHFS